MNRNRRQFLRTGLAAGSLAVAGCAATPPTDGDAGEGDGSATDSASASDSDSDSDDAGGDPARSEVETITDDLDQPWGLAVTPDGSVLVTERPGGFVRVAPDGTTARLDGAPEVFAGGQGGLLDVALHPDYPDPAWVYLTYAVANDAGETTTRLGRGRLTPDTTGLADFEVLHSATPYVESNGHFGSRVAFGPDRRVYVTVGDRQFKDFGPDHVAQDLTTDLGAVLRFEPDGSVPGDNPFVDDPDARDPIFSYGHRNPQGLAVHPETGAVWEHEHGEQDGDEINLLEAGGNFGWPVATEACTYGGGDPIGVSHADRTDVVAPVHYWRCGSGGFPPSGLAIYDGPADAWRGDLFAGNLAGQYLGRFAVDGRAVTEVERLLDGRGWRIRAVTVGPDGGLLAAVDADPGPLVRITPP